MIEDLTNIRMVVNDQPAWPSIRIVLIMKIVQNSKNTNGKNVDFGNKLTRTNLSMD